MARVFLFTLLLAACSGTAPQTEEAGERLRIQDATGDLADLDDNPVSGFDYIDIRSLEVEIQDETLRARLTVGEPPPRLDGDIHQVNYLLVFDISGDDRNFDYWLGAENRGDNDYHFMLSDWIANYIYDEEEFPGSGSIDGRVIEWELPMSALDDPDILRVYVWTQKSEDFNVQAEDYLPGSFEWASVRP